VNRQFFLFIFGIPNNQVMESLTQMSLNRKDISFNKANSNLLGWCRLDNENRE